MKFDITAKVVAQSASRALWLLITKCKIIGGVPYEVFSKLYDSIVWPVIDYGSAIWGSKSFSCITAVQNRAMRYFLGVGKYTPNAAVIGEMAWQPPIVRQWKNISRYWARLSNIPSSRINKRIALWAYAKANNACKNWMYIVKSQISRYNLNQFCDINVSIPVHSFVDKMVNKHTSLFINDWKECINRVGSISGRGHNKLRTYRLFKTEFTAERCCQLILPLRHRSAFIKFRCGVAPIRIETGRYENIALEDRKCHVCTVLEDEMHVILDCSLYDDLRINLFERAYDVDPTFKIMTQEAKLILLFTHPYLIRICAKTCFNILQRHSFYICK